jgi:hypothetical protein
MATIDTRIDKNLSKLEAQLKLWGAKFNEVAAKANVAGQQASIDSRKRVDDMKAKLKVAQSKLDEAKAAGAEKWETLKLGVEHVWNDLETTFKKLVH